MYCHLQPECCSAENNVMKIGEFSSEEERHKSPLPFEMLCQRSHGYLCNGLARVESVFACL